jgi:hypothetical protein
MKRNQHSSYSDPDFAANAMLFQKRKEKKRKENSLNPTIQEIADELNCMQRWLKRTEMLGDRHEMREMAPVSSPLALVLVFG